MGSTGVLNKEAAVFLDAWGQASAKKVPGVRQPAE